MPRTRFEMVADDGAAPRDALIRDLDQSNTAYTALKLPSPVFYQPLNAGHDGGIIVGRTNMVTIEPGGRARTVGEFYDGETDQANAPRIWEAAREAVHMSREGAVAPSIDPTVLVVEPNAEGAPALTVADFSGVTLVGMPAKVGTYVTFPDDEVEVDDDAPVPTSAEVARMVEDEHDDFPGDDNIVAEALGLDPAQAQAEASLRALIAAVNEAPPAELFARPNIPGYQPGYRIDGNRITGHLAALDACHLNWPGECVTPPPSASGYAIFRRYALTTTTGEIPVGRLTSGLGQLGNGCGCCDPEMFGDHACPNTKGLIAAMSHHDLMTTLADVNIGEDDGVIWVAGVLRPNLPAGAEAVLARRTWSGDWRPLGDADELVEILALDRGKPGFAKRVKTSRTRSVLIAAAGPTEEPAPPAPVEETPDVPALVANAVRSHYAIEAMNTAVSDAAQARARAELTRLERS